MMQETEHRGAALEEAEAVVVCLHGRGATARGILGLADELALGGVAYLAPQAARRSWYPRSFMAPVEQNEPALSSALHRVGEVLQQVEDAGISASRTVLLGFSQGACLATEYAARRPQRYGGVVGLSGGLVGPEDDPLDHEGSLEGTPVFLGCSDQDPHIPLERVQDTADVLDEMNADVETRIYPGMGHTVNDDELDAVRDLVARLVPSARRRTSYPVHEDDEEEVELDDSDAEIYDADDEDAWEEPDWEEGDEELPDEELPEIDEMGLDELDEDDPG